MSEAIPRIYGTELETSVVAIHPVMTSHQFDARQYHQLMDARLPRYLPEGVVRHNEFTNNGGRLYMDLGHIEVTTPECLDIQELLAYDLAAEQIVFQSLQNMVNSEEISGFKMNRRVRDNAGNYWGAHENYQTERAINPKNGHILGALATHLATRTVFTGAGRVSRKGFNLAQKMEALGRLEHKRAHYKDARPLVDTKNEPLANNEKFRRIQVSCGDANILKHANLLKFGSTSLLLRLLEHNVPLSDLYLAKPLAEAKKIASDDSLEHVCILASGKTAKPAEIQYEMARRAEKLSSNIQLPAEEYAIIQHWQDTCEKLLMKPESLFGKVDWITRKMFIERKIPNANAHNVHSRRAYDLKYDEVSSGVGYQIQAKIDGADTQKVQLINRAMVTPTDTRAQIRSEVVHSAIQGSDVQRVSWDFCKIKEKTYFIKDPFVTSSERINWALQTN